MDTLDFVGAGFRAQAREFTRWGDPKTAEVSQDNPLTVAELATGLLEPDELKDD